MKFVIFKLGPVFHPVLFPDHVCHDSVQMADATVVSAGFFYLGQGGVQIPETKSESLGIGPEIDRDSDLIVASLANMGMYAFLCQDCDAEAEHMERIAKDCGFGATGPCEGCLAGGLCDADIHHAHHL
jgi:hypothetical protein